MIGSLTPTVLRTPVVSALALLSVTCVFALGIPRLSSEAGYRAFLGERHEAIRTLDAFTERFGGGLPFAAVWSCAESAACASALDRPSLRMAHRVTRTLEQVPGVLRVDSPATSPLLVQPDLGFPEARRLAANGRPPRDLDWLAVRALRDPTWRGQILSADGTAGAIVLQLEDSAPQTGVRALQALQAALAPFEAEGFAFDLVGGPVEFVVAGEELEAATAEMVPVMVLLTGIVLVVLFRRPGPAVVGLAAVGVALVWTLGFLGWMGWPQNSLTQVLPPLVLVIGVCDGVHLLAAYARRLPASGSAAGRRRA